MTAPVLRPPRAYPPITSEHFQRLVTFQRQCQTYDRDPASAPFPDASLLEAENFGSVSYVRLGHDADGHEVLFFKVPPHSTLERSAPPRIMLMLCLLLAFRPSCTANDNGRGWSYVRPWGGNDRHQLGRLVENAPPGTVVVQRKSADFRKQDGFTARSSGSFTQETGKPTSSPRTGRSTAVAVALRAHATLRARRSGIDISAEAYEALLWEAFELVDDAAPLKETP